MYGILVFRDVVVILLEIAESTVDWHFDRYQEPNIVYQEYKTRNPDTKFTKNS